MTPETFVREASYLFSMANLSQIQNERPEKIASQKLNRKFKAFIKSQFPDCTLHGFSDGYCESSGFVERNGKFIYISISDLRYWKNWTEDVLIRTASSEKDYRGNMNHKSSIKKLKLDIEKLFAQYEKEIRFIV